MTAEKVILFTTGNPHKVERFKAYYSPLGIKVVTTKDLNVKVQVEEDGKTPEENAQKKARAYWNALKDKKPVFAIDYGLYIDKFPEDKQPGLFVRRRKMPDGSYCEMSDEEMLDYYARELEKVGGESEAKWISSIVLVWGENNDESVAMSTSRRTLMTSKKSDNSTSGEPLNALQIDPKSGKYFTDLTSEEWLLLQSEREKSYVKFMEENIDKLK